jgi:hypothetical protein
MSDTADVPLCRQHGFMKNGELGLAAWPRRSARGLGALGCEIASPTSSRHHNTHKRMYSCRPAT